MIPPLWQKAKRKPLGAGEKGECKSWLKTDIQKTKIMASGPIISWQIDGRTMETVREGGFSMGNTCKSMADSCHCMAKATTNCKVISLQLVKINEK